MSVSRKQDAHEEVDWDPELDSESRSSAVDQHHPKLISIEPNAPISLRQNGRPSEDRGVLGLAVELMDSAGPLKIQEEENRSLAAMLADEIAADGPIGQAVVGFESTHSVVVRSELHLKNGLRLSIFQVSGRYYLEIKGLSEGRIGSLLGARDHVERFSSVEDLFERIAFFAQGTHMPFPDPGEKPFRNNASVVFVASEKNFLLFRELLENHLEILQRSEHRERCRVLVVPEAIVSAGCPVALRNFLRSKVLDGEGVTLLGRDLVSFEVAVDAVGTRWRGQTDLPYGDFRASFWDRPVRTPGFKPYDMKLFADELLATGGASYQQVRWVSRWLASDEDPDTMIREFSCFLRRRQSYRPAKHHNVFRIRHGSGSLAGLDRNTRFLRVEHGHSEFGSGMGPSVLGEAEWLPPFIYIASSFPYLQLIQGLTLEAPPISVVVSPVHDGLHLLPREAALLSDQDDFLGRWKEGRTLGQRQIEMVNEAVNKWSRRQHDAAWIWCAHALFRVFVGYSIFGSGEFER